MSSESMSLFSPKLAARLDALVLKYPLRRSALVPMLLFAQDEIGYLSDAVIAEVAARSRAMMKASLGGVWPTSESEPAGASIWSASV